MEISSENRKMTKVELGDGTYQGSKIFSSLADGLGLSVDLVSSSVCCRVHESRERRNRLEPTQKSVPSHIALRKEEKIGDERKEKLPPTRSEQK